MAFSPSGLKNQIRMRCKSTWCVCVVCVRGVWCVCVCVCVVCVLCVCVVCVCVCVCTRVCSVFVCVNNLCEWVKKFTITNNTELRICIHIFLTFH